jgi:hypothetical protein
MVSPEKKFIKYDGNKFLNYVRHGNFMKKVAILQSNYIPWKGYFDLIGSVDEFIFYDEVQYTKNDWRNRNKIKTSKGLTWLTIPVGQKINRKINEVVIEDSSWQRKHFQAISLNYKYSPYYEEISNLLKPIYFESNFIYLSDVNRIFIQHIMRYLNIQTPLFDSLHYDSCDGKNEKLIDLCLQAKADIYVSGSKAKNYLDLELFKKNNIKVQWFDYTNYPEYFQLWGDFAHEVSIIDLLFNHGKKSVNFMKSTLKGET